jgi:NAD(P)-dependent dehydrogenase (short-subunit alcohol dehydrogenase family)
MSTKVKEKIAIITGGSSGIGFSIARKFVSENIRVVIIGRDKAKLIKACDSLGKLAGCLACDLTLLEDLPGIVCSIFKAYGKIDILVNCAGIHLKRPISDVSDDDYKKVILNNQTSLFCLTREVSLFMEKAKSGNILNISSMASQYGLPDVIAYTASKSAIEGMTRAMASELSPKGIRVNCIAPGFIKTDMSAKAFESDPERKKKVLSRTPMGRLGTTDEIAEAAYFLVSDSASFITGVVLPVDGGNSIGF